MLVSKMLHPLVPALIVPEINELLEHYGTVLTRNGRNAAVRGTAAS